MIRKLYCWYCAHIAGKFVLGNRWYEHNGYYKYSVGTYIRTKGRDKPAYAGWGPKSFEAVVVRTGYTESITGFRTDFVYLILNLDTGEVFKSYKWNTEYQFKKTGFDPNFDPMGIDCGST